MKNTFHIGDRVFTKKDALSHDGTVVDIVDNDNVKVYWRQPLLIDGQVRSHRNNELIRET